MDKRAYSTRRMKFPQQKPRRNSPTRLLVLLIALLMLFYLLGLLGRSCGGQNSGELISYLDKTNKIVEKSNQISKGFDALKSDAANVSRKELKSRLSQYGSDSKKLLADSEAIIPPEDMTKAHGYFTFCMELRASGLQSYGPALLNGLEDIDLEVASGQIARSLKDLALGDRVYARFSSEAGSVAKKAGVKKTIPKSRFLAEDTAYEKTSILPYLQKLKSAKGLEEVHGISILEMTTEPKQIKVITSKKLAVLPSADSISVTVTIENQGNQIEVNIPIVAKLKSESQTKEQEEQAFLTSLAPGQKKKVTISGLAPTQDPDVVNLLTVTAGPLPKEKSTSNNVQELKFMME